MELPVPMKFKVEIPTFLATVRPADAIPRLKPRPAVTTPTNAALPVVVTVATPEPTSNLDPSNVRLASAFRVFVVPVFVITLLSA